MICFVKIVSRLQNQSKILHRQKVVNLWQNTWSCRYLHTEESINTDKIVEDLCDGNKELEKKLKIIMLEVDVMRQDGRHAPDNMRTTQWKRLLDLPSRTQRTNYLTYLWKTEKAKENEKAKKAERRKEYESGILRPPQKEYPDDQEYGLNHQTMFLRIRDKSINNFDNYRALQAMLYGQSLAIDCSYEDKMVWREILNAAKQTTLLFGDNRLSKEPFNIHLCNVKKDGDFMKHLEINIPSLLEPWFPMNIHESSYLDIFPKKDLVYLTPHCHEELTGFNHDAVYIVGCMVDKVNNEALSLAKAKRDGIKMAKLPLDRYLEWAPGSRKTLNINHVVKILLDLKLTGDWKHSFRSVPRRKLMETTIMAMENRQKSNMLRDVVNLKTKSKFSGNKFMAPARRHRLHSLFDDSDKF